MPKFDTSSHVVNISTMGAVQGSVKFPGLSVYSSSKSATVNLTEIVSRRVERAQGPKNKRSSVGRRYKAEMLEEAFPGIYCAYTTR